MKKIIFNSLLCTIGLCGLLLTNCGKQNPPPEVFYKALFYDACGNKISEQTVKENECCDDPGEQYWYDGPAYIHKFIGWSPSIDTKIKKNTLFVPIFTTEITEFVATFLDTNGEVLYKKNCKYNETAYDSNVSKLSPKKESDDKHFEYTFAGWDIDPKVIKMKSNMTFKPIFDTTRYCNVVFNTDEGSNTVLCKYGDKCNAPNVPDVLLDDGTFKVFKERSEDVSCVVKDMNVHAIYQIVPSVTVTFNDNSGNFLYECTIPQGSKAEFVGEEPTRESTMTGNYRNDYKFVGWSTILDAVFEDVVVTPTWIAEEVFVGGHNNHSSSNGKITLCFTTTFPYTGHSNYKGTYQEWRINDASFTNWGTFSNGNYYCDGYVNITKVMGISSKDMFFEMYWDKWTEVEIVSSLGVGETKNHAFRLMFDMNKYYGTYYVSFGSANG